MDTVGSFQLKTHLSELLARVAEGEVITITRNGRPIAKLSPIDATATKLSPADAVRAFQEFRRKRPRSGLTAKEALNLRHEGHLH